jgi:hypothetical protein
MLVTIWTRLLWRYPPITFFQFLFVVRTAHFLLAALCCCLRPSLSLCTNGCRMNDGIHLSMTCIGLSPSTNGPWHLSVHVSSKLNFLSESFHANVAVQPVHGVAEGTFISKSDGLSYGLEVGYFDGMSERLIRRHVRGGSWRNFSWQIELLIIWLRGWPIIYQ